MIATISLGCYMTDEWLRWIRQQFEQDLKQKALAQYATDQLYTAPVFQSAYDELIKAIEFFQIRRNVTTPRQYQMREKSYESVMKVVLQVDRGNADKLTKDIVGRGYLSLPESMASEGFREKVLMSLPYIRNNSTASHGAGRSMAEISKNMANLAINLASALNSYLIDVFKEQV